MENVHPNIPLIPGRFYEFNYDNRHYVLPYDMQDEQGIHFNEYSGGIVWDFIIPNNEIENVIFTEEFEGRTDNEYRSESEQEGGKYKKSRKHKKRVKRRTRKFKKNGKHKKSRKAYK